MNPELVSDERREALWHAWRDSTKEVPSHAHPWIQGDRAFASYEASASEAFVAGISAALKELGVVLVIDLDKETMKHCERDDMCHADIIKKKLSYEDCPFEEGGALLVRVKEKP